MESTGRLAIRKDEEGTKHKTYPSIQPLFLANFDAKKRVVRVLVPPAPVLLLLRGAYTVPLAIFHVPLLYILAVRLVFVVVPPVVVFVLPVVIAFAVIVVSLHHKRSE
jgi:hypothetical protein